MHITRVSLCPERYPTLERYPFSLPTFQRTHAIAFSSPVTLFVGENGTGKSTLLRGIARRCGIHIWQETEGRRYDRSPYEDSFHEYITVEWVAGSVPGSYFGSEIFRDFARTLDEWAAADPGQLRYFGGKSLMTLSHGQSLMSFFRARYRIKGLYFLDEPETALSPKSQLALLHLLGEMSQAGHAQFIIATHSPILLACPDAQILSFDSIPICPIAYEQTEHYRLYKSFMEDPNRYRRADRQP
jgi:predicted ATPase